jgi:uncharacterized membrane protein YoaK (UPF0700 family)
MVLTAQGDLLVSVTKRPSEEREAAGGETRPWRNPAENSSFFRDYGPKLAVALVLTFASGFVDIVGYMGVFRFFTAHLTGTTVQLGRSLVGRDWANVSAAGAIVLAFFCGSILGRVLIEAGSRKGFRRIASITLAIEAAILAVVATGKAHPDGPYLILGLLAASMGIQTATLTGVGPLTVHTTFVTGMVNKLAQLTSRVAFRVYDSLRSTPRTVEVQQNQKRDIQISLFLAAIWLFYVAGAVAGTLSFGAWGLSALFIAVGLLAVSFAVDQFRPLAIQEEKEQSET